MHGTGALDQPTARAIQIQGHDLRTLTARRLAELRRLVIG
ncbi:MAG: ABC-type lipoprotein export system ATPase subunit, partial [Planctomycetota bacterium]